MAPDLVTLERVNAWYGDSHVLHGLDMRVAEGEVVALLGRNGVGKTTTLKTIMGVLDRHDGAIRFAGHDVARATPERRARAGIQLVPEERRIFAGLTVEENLKLARMGAARPLAIDTMYCVFPRLGERRASLGRHLSGGEQQMLSVARAMVQAPRLLMLDEPFEGLAPIIIQALTEVVARLAREGQTILIVEQNLRACLALASRAYVLANGAIVYEGAAGELLADEALQRRYLSV